MRTKRDFKYWLGTDKTYLKSIHPLMDVADDRVWDVSEWPTEDEEAAEDMYMDQIATSGCPFAWLLWDTNTTDPAI